MNLLEILKKNADNAKSYIDGLVSKKQDTLTFDIAPTKGSQNPVTSDGIQKAIAAKTVDLSNYPTKDGIGATGNWSINAATATTATKATQDASGNIIADTYETKVDAAAFSDGCTDEAINKLWYVMQTGTRFVFNKNDNMGPIGLVVDGTTYTLNGTKETRVTSSGQLFDIESTSSIAPPLQMNIKYDSTVTPAITSDLFSSDGVLHTFIYKNHQVKLTKDSDNVGLLFMPTMYEIGDGIHSSVSGYGWSAKVASQNGDWTSTSTDSTVINNVLTALRTAYSNGENLVIEFIPKS